MQRSNNEKEKVSKIIKQINIKAYFHTAIYSNIIVTTGRWGRRSLPWVRRTLIYVSLRAGTLEVLNRKVTVPLAKPADVVNSMVTENKSIRTGSKSLTRNVFKTCIPDAITRLMQGFPRKDAEICKKSFNERLLRPWPIGPYRPLASNLRGTIYKSQAIDKPCLGQLLKPFTSYGEPGKWIRIFFIKWPWPLTPWPQNP